MPQRCHCGPRWFMWSQAPAPVLKAAGMFCRCSTQLVCTPSVLCTITSACKHLYLEICSRKFMASVQVLRAAQARKVAAEKAAAAQAALAAKKARSGARPFSNIFGRSV